MICGIPCSYPKCLTLTREIPATFPDQLSGDAFRLRQILLNFLGNACKFSDQGTITVRVSAVEQDSDSVLARIEVEDQGIGISPEQQAMLFQPFTQVDDSMTRNGDVLVISRQSKASIRLYREPMLRSNVGNRFR